MLIDFLIMVLIIVVVFMIVRYAVRCFIKDPPTQEIIILVLGVVAVIALLVGVRDIFVNGGTMRGRWL